MEHRNLMSERPHRRLNALTGEWLLVSPHRATRPWQGQVETPPAVYRPPYSADCYLCPGNPRAGGARNADYTGTFVFTNDFPALLQDIPDDAPPATVEGQTGAGAAGHAGLFGAQDVRGTCRVICFSPRHDLTLADMDIPSITEVVGVWAQQVAELGEIYRWVQVFENKGEIMGCSNPHPHGQIWASDVLPEEPLKEDLRQREYLSAHATPLLRDYARAEEAAELRIVAANEDWIAVVPWWAMWPFEALLMPRRRLIPRLPDLTDEERHSLAAMLKNLLGRYDSLFGVSFPYTMGWHGAPTGGAPEIGHWQLHAHFYPPLLRSATVRKFMVGYEMLAEAQRDITPEQAASRLRG